MISKKNYISILKLLPTYSTPKNLNNKILQKCGISSKESFRNTPNTLSQIGYGLICLVILFTTLIIGIKPTLSTSDRYTIIAGNGKVLSGQLISGLYNVFTDIE